MAKNKKSSSKAAKKSPAKAKSSAKVKSKKATPAKAKKTAPKKVKKAAAPKAVKKAAPKKPAAKVVAKKEAPKKVAPKKEAPKKVAAPKVAPPKVEKSEKIERPAPLPKAAVPQVEKPMPVAPPKPAPPQLSIFPVPNQRPIAHKQTNIPSTDTRTRYSEEELKEFEALIHKKLDKARDEYRILKETLNRNNDEGTDATSGGNTKVLEDGAETAEKENLSQLAARQQKYIMNLENALVRIKNGTYGICSVTGKLIPKERLIAVPHTTQSIEAKMMQHD
jgi:RNA polymerase-binding transcription factor DksA